MLKYFHVISMLICLKSELSREKSQMISLNTLQTESLSTLTQSKACLVSESAVVGKRFCCCCC